MGRIVVNVLWLTACLASPLVARAQDTESGPAASSADQAGQLLAQEQAAFAAAAAAVSPSVVQIETFGGLERVGKELISDGPTTGTIVGKEGWIISSMYSFRQQPASILVSLSDGSRLPAKIVARDTSRELVLLKIDAKTELPEPTACPIDQLSVGQWAIGLGRTFDREAVSQSVGILSALGRAYGKAVQTDAKVSPVNYGGPLVDLQGRVIGILAPISPGAILEGDSSQLYDSGVGFAIPLVDILERLPKMQSGEDIHSGKLGIVVADQNELAGPVKVAGAAPGSPAAKAGLKPGDTIVAAEGHPVQLLAHLRHALGVRDAGSPFKFTVLREGKRIELVTTLVEQVPTYRLRYLGIEAENLVGGGVRITKIWPKTPADEAKLVAGMRITACSEAKVTNTTQLRQQISIAEIDVPLELKIIPADEKGKDAEPESRKVKVTTWPTKIEAYEGSADNGRSPAAASIEETELALADFPNKAWVWSPAEAADNDTPKAKEDEAADEAEDTRPLVAERELGLLLLLPEPGEVDRDKLREMWTPLIDQGWCVAIIQSGDKSRWSAEEIELVERVRSQVADKWSLDAARTVVGGLGVGGRMALIGARSLQDKAVGVLLLATPLEGVKVQRENTPSDSLHFLSVGPRESYREFLEQLQKLGYPAVDLPVPELVPSKWDTVPVEQITDWLLGLGRI